MLSWLRRYWFLLALATGLALGMLAPGVLGPATAWLEPDAAVVIALFLMACTLPSRSLAAEIARPWAALWALALSYGLLPAAAWWLSAYLEIDFRIGALVSAAGPCTLASAVLWTRLAGGNEAAALLVTIVSTASSWLITTAWLTALTGQAVTLDAADLMSDLVVKLIVPVALGQLCRAWPPLLALITRYRMPLGVVSQLVILGIVFRAAAEVGKHLAGGSAALGVPDLLNVAAFCLGLHLAVLTVGWWSSRRLGFDRPRCIAVSFASSQKTLPVAMLIFTKYFPQYPLGILPILFYHAGQLIGDTAIAKAMRNSVKCQ